jgi:nicotinamide-nucleotide adenylyltransferase
MLTKNIKDALKIGCYWGRFNPPHKGHMQVIKKLIKKVDKLIIAIGRSEIKNTKKDPFSGKERTLMFREYLKEEKINIKRIKIVNIIEGKSYSESVRRFVNTCPKFDVLFLSDEKNTLCKYFKDKSKIQRFPRSEGGISATKIRDAIAKNKPWGNLTGESVVKIIKKINGINRIKKAYKLNNN